MNRDFVEKKVEMKVDSENSSIKSVPKDANIISLQ
jgi:hypothetical protein